MRSAFTAVALVAATVGLLGGREAKCAGWSAGPGCPQCSGGLARGHGGHHIGQSGCPGDGDVWCPVYPAYVRYDGVRKLSWGQSLFPSARRYRVTEPQFFPPLPYSTPRVAPAPAPADGDALAPVM